MRVDIPWITQKGLLAVLILAPCVIALGQTQDPAYSSLSRAYESFKARDYDTAIPAFLQAIQASPLRADIRKDLAYAYLKIGENELARDQFREAMRLDPNDAPVALEYGFLCFETKQPAEARRVFNRLRHTAAAPYAPTAEQAFHNIDDPLAAGIERWTKAIEMGADNFGAHFELATLAEQRDDLALAAGHYERAWRLMPTRRSVLVDLGRVWKALNRTDDALAILVAASRCGDARTAEAARALLPDRYPYVSEFKHALDLDPQNVELRREFGFLLLRIGRQPEAEQEFREITVSDPGDLLSAAQLGFLLLARGEREAAMPLLERVLAGKDEDLANRVRAVLRLPQTLKSRADPAAVDAKTMAERSIQAGYLQDALRYLTTAHEADPSDYSVMLKLGWVYNMLHQDDAAYRWFSLARGSPDPRIAADANRAWNNLRPAHERLRLSAWFYPMYSSRWHDVFGYAQVRSELRVIPGVRIYASARFVGDWRQTTTQTATGAPPQYLSESAVIVGAGLHTLPWHGLVAWGEAGSSMSYLNGHKLPDYRGGLSFARGAGHTLRGEAPGWFADTAFDAVFISRFDNDAMLYNQSRLGFTFGPPSLRAQLYWNGGLTIDDKRQYWANFVETGPGIRITGSFLPKSMFFTVNAMRGAYLINTGNPRGPNFNDFRAGFWYAFAL